MKDKKALTVTLNAYVYKTQLDEIKEDLVDELNSEYTIEGGMSGDVSEVVFVFDEDADLAALKTKAEAYLDTKLANTGANYSVSASVETMTAVFAKHYALRAAIAGAVLAVLAFAYVAVRYNLANGIAAGVSVLLGMLLTASIIVLTRVYVTESVAIVITLAGLLTAAMTLFTLNNVRSAKKAGNDVDGELVASSVAVKEVLYTAAVLAVGSIVVGVLGGAATVWFAAAAVIAILASVFTALIFAPCSSAVCSASSTNGASTFACDISSRSSTGTLITAVVGMAMSGMLRP
jgi:preprotein translocase subunit SecF